MAHLTSNRHERAELKQAAADEFPTDPALAYVLEHLAADGIDLDTCQDWETLRTALSLPARDEAADVA